MVVHSLWYLLAVMLRLLHVHLEEKSELNSIYNVIKYNAKDLGVVSAQRRFWSYWKIDFFL